MQNKVEMDDYENCHKKPKRIYLDDARLEL